MDFLASNPPRRFVKLPFYDSPDLQPNFARRIQLAHSAGDAVSPSKNNYARQAFISLRTKALQGLAPALALLHQHRW